MKGVLVDSNIILDVFEADPVWVEWSESLLEFYGGAKTSPLKVISPENDEPFSETV